MAACHNLEDGELLLLLRDSGPDTREFLRQQAQAQAQAFYGSQVFIRGLIEFTNFCKNDCYYCGIRRSNPQAQRYRLSQEQILACCQAGYKLGFRTFVLQGGEDPWFTDERLCAMVRAIKERWPDCAVTLSVGERSRESYRLLKEAGADRYLLRHETATPGHYQKLHPPELSLAHRLECLRQLKELGYQVGAGFMVGSPYQTLEDLVRDLRFLKEFGPHMVGIGPFLSQKDTPFRDFPNGSGELTLLLLSLSGCCCRGCCCRHHRLGHAAARRPGAGHPPWGQCGDAQPLPGGRPGEVHLVRQQAPLGGGGAESLGLLRRA